MNILFIVPYTPNPIRVRSYNLIHALARRGHQITLATLWSSAQDKAQLAELEQDGIRVLVARLTRARSLWNCARALPRPTPLQSVYCWQPALLEMMNAECGRQNPPFDVIHMEHLRGARFATHLQSEILNQQSAISNQQSAIPLVWDSVDCISYLFEQAARDSRSPFGRWAARMELPRTRWYEARLVGQFDRVLVTSEQDKRAFCDLLQEFAALSLYPPLPAAGGSRSPDSGRGARGGGAKINVLRNGVDLDYFAPGKAAREARTIVFSGKMSYHANVTAALYLVNEIMPRVWERVPNAQVQIVGQNPPRQVRDLARKDPERVAVAGTVEDIRPYLAQAAVAVAPMTYGAGIQNKVLEAMAMATPVVATTLAAAALAVRNEEQALIGDDAESFSQGVVRLLRSQSLRERLGENGRRYVELNHDWNRIAGELESVYQEAIEERVSE